jgi:integrase
VRIPSDAESQRQHPISDAEEVAYFRVAGRRFPALYDVGRLMLLQGLRPDEVMRVHATDVDLPAGTLRVREGKTKAARRTLTLTGEALSILTPRVKLAGPSGWLFAGKTKGTRLTKLNGSHAKVLEEVGLSFCLYDLRHTFATRLAGVGVDPFTLAAILGHSGVRCVSRYVHPTAEHQAEAMKRYEATLKTALRLVK